MRNAFAIFILAAVVWPAASFAKMGESFETSGWIPYWRAERGIANILPQLDKFTEVNPFVYTVRQDGGLYLNSPLDSEPWTTLRARSRELNIRYIPTVMWANPDAMDDVLRDNTKRAAHIAGIVREVYARGFDGIDIDYEAKYAKTRPYFSQFLNELNEAMGYDKWIMCTIEARTPLESRYSSPESIPADIEYANDFAEINKHCDRVRIMAYDQGRLDLKLNDAKGDPYAPVADTDWVEKVMRLTAEDIDKEKLVIGVATYGYEYDMFAELASGQPAAAAAAFGNAGEMRYSRLWSFNPGYALDIAAKLGLTPTRNSAGELSIQYPASQSPDSAIPLSFATRVMSWSDAGAIEDKAKLAKELGLRGVAVFKIDDGQDQGLWGVLAMHRDASPNASGLAIVPGAGEKDAVAVASISTAARPGLAAPSGIAVPLRDLEYGMRNEDVRALQRLLNEHGFTVAQSGGGSSGNETIFFGPATRTAVAAFQKAHGVSPTAGYFGPKTRAALQSKVACAVQQNEVC